MFAKTTYTILCCMFSFPEVLLQQTEGDGIDHGLLCFFCLSLEYCQARCFDCTSLVKKTKETRLEANHLLDASKNCSILNPHAWMILDPKMRQWRSKVPLGPISPTPNNQGAAGWAIWPRPHRTLEPKDDPWRLSFGSELGRSLGLAKHSTITVQPWISPQWIWANHLWSKMHLWMALDSKNGTWQGKPAVIPLASLHSGYIAGSSVATSSWMRHWGRCPSAWRASSTEWQNSSLSTTLRSLYSKPQSFGCVPWTWWCSIAFENLSASCRLNRGVVSRPCSRSGTSSGELAELSAVPFYWNWHCPLSSICLIIFCPSWTQRNFARMSWCINCWFITILYNFGGFIVFAQKPCITYSFLVSKNGPVVRFNPFFVSVGFSSPNSPPNMPSRHSLNRISLFSGAVSRPENQWCDQRFCLSRSLDQKIVGYLRR